MDWIGLYDIVSKRGACRIGEERDEGIKDHRKIKKSPPYIAQHSPTYLSGEWEGNNYKIVRFRAGNWGESVYSFKPVE